jgi:aminoglycoside phosphotransferase (APT) family kinase protein
VSIDEVEFVAPLRALLAATLADAALEIEALDRRGEGYSWETYLVSVRRGNGTTERFAVKREPNAGLLGSYDVEREADLLRAARVDIGCPVPAVIAVQPRAEAMRGYYVMEMVAGVVPMPWDVSKVVPDEATRRRLGLELATIMAKLHSKDVRELKIGRMTPPVDARFTGRDEILKWREIYLGCAAMRIPIIDLAFAWLEHSADAVSGRVALVHNDLRVGNVVVNEGRVAAVLDWETADFLDPSADLAKFNLPTFRGRSDLASGLVAWEEFLSVYEAGCGWRPEPRSLNFWTVLELVKAAVGALRGVHYFESGQTDDIRYANMEWHVQHSFRWLVSLYDSGKWGR